MGNQNLKPIRHSLAHLLAQAVLEKYPGTKIASGPPTDTGFYYDFDMPEGVLQSPLPLAEIETRMRELVTKNIDFVCKEVEPNEARVLFEDQPYRLEKIEEKVKSNEQLTIYQSGDFVDLCGGPHVSNTKEIDPGGFTLTNIAGAYWKGNENNKMLTRIYGLAFASKKDLDEYLEMQEEARKRDHRKLGKEMDLFTFSDLVGPGLPLWTPRGTFVRNQLDQFVWQLRKEKGYTRVEIPHITKKALYETSGHWSKFSDELFRVQSREEKEYALKPMNCPHHTQIFDRKPHSYRNMPQRYANTTMVYRDEQSGELGGLTRVLSITQDDAHVFCRQNQMKDEFFAIWDIIDTFYTAFGFTFESVRLSFHDPEQFDNYLGTKETWQKAEQALRDIAEERGASYYEAPGEATLYGPKVDFVAKDSLGREHQVATIQLDMNLPEQFDLTCINEEGQKERIVMLHAAIMGSLERFIAVLIEHTGGIFPVWLSPVQVKILPVSDDHKQYAQELAIQFTKADVRAEVDESNETVGKKVRNAQIEKVPYWIVVGDKERESGEAVLEGRLPVQDTQTGSGEKQDPMSVENIVEFLKSQIDERK